MATMRVQVVTPEREVEVSDDATFVLAHGIEGDLGILPGLAPTLIALGVGPLEIEHEGGGRDMMLVDGGFLQVKDNNVIVLAEYAVLPSELNAAEVSAEIDELKRRLQTQAEDESARKELLRAEAKQKMMQVG
jgi:F-type H+-transporting ATPase subunit epsilon